LSGEGVFFERCFVDTTAVMNFAVNLDRIAAVIRQVGITSTVLSTDFGQASNPPPVEGLRAYLSGLAIRGFKEEQIRLMAGDIPAYLLELDSSG
jgi:microsomal dipeptidase-like Zn-dependent dipeptidase